MCWKYLQESCGGISSSKLCKIKTLLEQSGSAGDIEDPYMMDRKTYYSILEQIDEACKRIIQKWIS
ncbi:MAG: hypothetical protein ACTSVU_04415 [Promethearchaeota archaeon]